MNDTTTDVTAYSSSVELPVSPDEAFALVTEPDRLRRWSSVCATVELRAGGAWSWHVTPSHTAGGTIREVDPGRRVVLGWGWQDDAALPPDSSTVTVTVEPSETGSRVTLTHDGLPNQQQVDGHAEGWDHYLERLERLAVKGDAGRDEWAWSPEDLDPVVAGYAVLATIQPMLRRLTPDDQPKPTPCTEMSCHQVAVHLMESMVSLGAMAGVELAVPAEGSLETKVSTLADGALSAWHARGLEGMVSDPGGREFPAALGPAIIDVELLLHGVGPRTGQRELDRDLRRGRRVRRRAGRPADRGRSRLGVRRRARARRGCLRPGPARGVLRQEDPRPGLILRAAGWRA